MGDRHGGCFARRGRALNPPHPQVDAHRGVGLRWRARAKEFAPRRNALLDKGLPTRRTSKRICPAQEHAPRQRPPDTAHEQKDLPHARRLSSAKASRHGARAKRFAPRENTPLGEGLPTRRTSERICPRAGTLPTAKASRHGAKAKGFAPTREGSPRRKPPDTAHEQKNLPRARRLSSAKASRHGARAKGFARARTRSAAKASRHGARAKRFAPRGSRSPHVPTNGGPPSTDGQPKNTPSAGSHPTRRTGERICPAQERSPRQRPPDTAHERKDLPAQGRSPRRRPPDTAHERKDLPRARTLSSAKASRHGARAKGFAPRGSRSPHVPTNGGPPSADAPKEKHPFGGVAPTACGRCRVHSPKKIRLLHETQLFYGESHVGSRQIFSSFPSVGRCVARERNPVPPVAPHRGSEPRGLRCTGEMVRRFDAMCPRSGEWLPRGGN